MEELLTTKEVAEQYKVARRTLYNMISRGQFVRGQHYYKPSPKKILFRREAIQEWLTGAEAENTSAVNIPRPETGHRAIIKRSPQNRINI